MFWVVIFVVGYTFISNAICTYQYIIGQGILVWFVSLCLSLLSDIEAFAI